MRSHVAELPGASWQLLAAEMGLVMGGEATGPAASASGSLSHRVPSPGSETVDSNIVSWRKQSDKDHSGEVLGFQASHISSFKQLHRPRILLAALGRQ